MQCYNSTRVAGNVIRHLPRISCGHFVIQSPGGPGELPGGHVHRAHHGVHRLHLCRLDARWPHGPEGLPSKQGLDIHDSQANNYG